MKTKRPSLKGRGTEIFLGDTTPKQETRLPEGQHSCVPEHPHARIPEYHNENSGKKEKATFYLPVEVVEDLEVLWRNLRGLTRKKIKKSDIVKVALEGVAREFKEKGEASTLVNQLS